MLKCAQLYLIAVRRIKMTNHTQSHASYLYVMGHIVSGRPEMTGHLLAQAAQEALAHHDEPCEHCWLNAQQTEAHPLHDLEKRFLKSAGAWSHPLKALRSAVEAKSMLADNNEHEDSRDLSCGGHEDEVIEQQIMVDKMAEMAKEFGKPAYNLNLAARYQDPDR